MAMIYAEEYYLPGATIPEVFLEADRQMAERHKNDPKIITKPRTIPMPFISGVKGVKGPIIVTEDWYVKEEKKKLARRAEDKRDMQIEMMQLLAQRDRLRFKLGQLDPTKKKDSKKIVSINIKLKDIDAELKMLQDQSGINMNELDKGTKFGRYVGHFKRFVHKVGKKIKKFYNDNKELICGIASVILPVVFAGAVRKIVGAILA